MGSNQETVMMTIQTRSQKKITTTTPKVSQKSKYGRTLQHPERYEHKRFVKGSGFKGCDTYDRKYHKSVRESCYEESDVKHYKCDDFVVSDSEEIEYIDNSEPEYSDFNYSEDCDSEESGE